MSSSAQTPSSSQLVKTLVLRYLVFMSTAFLILLGGSRLLSTQRSQQGPLGRELDSWSPVEMVLWDPPQTPWALKCPDERSLLTVHPHTVESH